MSSQPNPKWNEIKEKGGMFPLLLILFLYRIFGRGFIQSISYFIVMWYWLFSSHARQASLSYLKNLHVFAQPHSPFKQTPTWLQSYQHFLHFAEAIVDKMQGWLGEIPEQALKIYGHEHLSRHYGKGLVIVVSHFGNIELLRALKSATNQKINILVYQNHAQAFNQFLKKMNHHSTVSLIAVDQLGIDTTILLQDKIEAGEWVIIAADRVPAHSQRTQTLSFLGQPAQWPQGAWILANLLKVPVVASFCYRHQQQLEAHFHALAEVIDLPRQARMQQMAHFTTQYIQLLEQHCIKAPYQWFNFYQFWKIQE
ncbi:acyltransferase [Acinetobacter sp. MD2(2019)]|uniref:LpxL/LpxP family acyltransferase n=1 Tax=Acinetobacter sp. MD2(2019) TaxID=2605273 RepID=UPI002D1F6C2A|nr:acyltransferase [Acinetobacter sp. MD2(2019)]MEB3753607.1 acyltransferase [Acinetobacter sp. MD2(2019)]